MRTIETTVYKFDELNDKAKEQARDWYRQGDHNSFAWEQIKEDAEQIGLKITTLDDHRNNEGGFIGGPLETVKLILENHGKSCETYKTAERYQKELTRLYDADCKEETQETQDAYENCAHEFL